MISTEPNLTYSHTPAQLTINTDSLVLKRSSDSQILFSHKMEGISFASAGEHVRENEDLYSDVHIFFSRKQKITLLMLRKIIQINVLVMYFHAEKMNH